MRRFLQALGLFILWPLTLVAQNSPFSARSAALGHASVALTDIYGSWNNQASLAFLEKPTVGAFYENRYFMPELMGQGIAFAAPFKNKGTFGLNLYRFGYSEYNENKIGFAYAKNFGPTFSLGVQLNLHYMQFGDIYGSLFTASGEVSFLVRVSEKWHIGGHIFNPTRTPVADFNREKMATIFRLGMLYKFNDKLTATAEFEKDLLYEPTFRAGAEYHLAEPLYVRIGLNTNPMMPSFGMGLHLKKRLILDVAARWHQILGFAPQASLSYAFGK